jgi:hypothetical protein
MNAERIVEILLEGDLDPKEFMASLPPHVMNMFRFVPGFTDSPVKVYLYGEQGGQGFLGWIHPFGKKWYAWRAYDRDMPHGISRDTKEEAAKDLLNFVEGIREAIDPKEFMGGLPQDFWASFHIIRSGEAGVFADSPYGHLTHLVYLNKSDGTRDLLGYLRPEEGLWYVVQVVSLHLTQPGHGTYKRYPVLHGVAGVGFRSKEEAAKGLLRDYLTEK